MESVFGKEIRVNVDEPVNAQKSASEIGVCRYKILWSALNHETCLTISLPSRRQKYKFTKQENGLFCI